MPAQTPTLPDPQKVRAGRLGALKRWGMPRVVRLDGLTPTQRQLIVALIDATKKAAPNANGTAQEVSSASSNTTASAA